jgi:phosphoribosyl-ATP pyrophosphohydrolase/phosphoribosyl-AMP cyclohydrolase
MSLAWDSRGLIPVVVRDRLTGELRMLAYANAEALAKTRETGLATFWSRSRGELWVKGQTSGNEIRVHRVLVDCDLDALVYEGEPAGPSCHTGKDSCFFRALDADGAVTELAAEELPQSTLGRLEAVLDARKTATSAKSYTRSLYDGGASRIGDKVREEGDELARALADESDERVVSEAADVLFHVLVGLRFRGISFRDVLTKLEARSGTSGHEEKAARTGASIT